MKKKLILAAAALAVLCISVFGLFFVKNRVSLKKTEAESPAKPQEALVDELDDKSVARERAALAGEEVNDRRTAAPAAAKDKGKAGFFSENKKYADGTESLGRIFTPVADGERRLEYNIAVNYQIGSLKSARAFFNQWIPRYGFLLNETATGHQNGYMTLRVRVRSANLYAALNDLDAIGALTSENISVTDHTENGVYQQMLAQKAEIRNRRRMLANANTGTGSKNWEASENLLSQSEDKQLAARMEEWRIADRTGWATLQITLSLPVSAVPAPVEVPEFRNAFVGLLNVLLQLMYALIYIVPLALVGYLAYRGIVKAIPGIKRILPRAAT